MTSETTKSDSADDPAVVTKSRTMALPGRPLDHISQPVLNRPHEEPSRHWQLAEDNTSTGWAIDGRRLSQALVIVPKERGAQQRMQVTAAEQNELVNRIRDAVALTQTLRWRGRTGSNARRFRLACLGNVQATDPSPAKLALGLQLRALVHFRSTSVHKQRLSEAMTNETAMQAT